MGNFLSKLRANEPVRLYVYPAVVVLMGILVAKGVVDNETSDFVSAAVALLLGIGAAEGARSKAFSPASVQEKVQLTATSVAAEVKSEIAEKINETNSPQVQRVLESVTEAVAYIGGRHRKPE